MESMIKLSIERNDDLGTVERMVQEFSAELTAHQITDKLKNIMVWLGYHPNSINECLQGEYDMGFSDKRDDDKEDEGDSEDKETTDE